MTITIIQARLPVQGGNVRDYVSDASVFDRWYPSPETAAAALNAVRLGPDESGVDMLVQFVEVEADLDDDLQHWTGHEFLAPHQRE